MKTDPVFRSPDVARKGAIALNAKRRSERVAARLAEEASREENFRAILQVFEDALSPESPAYIRLEAAKALLAIESKEHELALRREGRRESVSKEVLVERLAERIFRLQEAGVFSLPVVSGNTPAG